MSMWLPEAEDRPAGTDEPASPFPNEWIRTGWRSCLFRGRQRRSAFPIPQGTIEGPSCRAVA